MHEVPSGPEKLVVQGDFTGFNPEELFDHFVNPDLLTLWWPEKATVTPGQSGTMRLEWPGMGWVLESTFTEWNPGKRLAFTWKWNHEPVDKDPLLVSLDFSPSLSSGTVLTVTHGPYDTSEEQQEERRGHLEGWIHFGMRLAGLRPGLAE